MLATINGLEFVGDGASGTYTISANGLIGWFEGVGVRNEQIPRPISDGVFDSPGYLTGRLITLQGLVLASSDAAFEAALGALGDIPVLDLTEFVVTTGAGSKAAMVRRVDKPDVSFDVWGRSAAYRLSLFAPDPALYVPTP
ncbi:hypothetical protein [Microbacterium sp. NPDC055455]